MPGIVFLLLAFLAFECVAVAMVLRVTRRDQDTLDDAWADQFVADLTGVIRDPLTLGYKTAFAAAQPSGILSTARHADVSVSTGEPGPDGKPVWIPLGPVEYFRPNDDRGDCQPVYEPARLITATFNLTPEQSRVLRDAFSDVQIPDGSRLQGDGQ